MRFYWSLKQVPELAELSPAERRRVHRACYSRYPFKSPRCIIALVACGLCGAAGTGAGGLIHFALGIPLSIWQPLVGAGIGGAIGGFIFGQTVTSYLRPYY